MPVRALTRGGLCLALAWAITACQGMDATATRSSGASGPSAMAAKSRDLTAYFEGHQQRLLKKGALRRDGHRRDVVVTANQLTEAFMETAMHREYTGGGVSRSKSPNRLSRWTTPVRYTLTQSDAPAADRDAATVRSFAARLQNITGHSVTPAGRGEGNFHVMILDEASRQGIGPALRRHLPEINDDGVATVIDLRRSFHCLALASVTQGGRYESVVIVIRAELPDLMRTACIHEEMAQAMGISNDSPDARPSIFNDDAEFALLTWHDEILLSMLYDSRLRTGMSVRDARPIVRALAQEALAERRG